MRVRGAGAALIVTALAVAPGARALQADAPQGRLVLTALSPYAGPDTPLSIKGQLVNEGSQPLRGLQLVIRVGAALRSRSALHQEAGKPDENGGRRTEVGLAGEVSPGGLLQLDQVLPTADVGGLGGDLASLHALHLELRAAPCTGCRRETVATIHTFLVWWPGQRIAPTRIAWVWPLLSAVHRGPDQVFTDDGLAAELKPAGRLSTLLAAPLQNEAMVTWAVDPQLIAAAAAMRDGYEVRTGDRTAAGVGREDARHWVADARRALATSPDQVLALPYADPDLNALVRNGLTTDLVKAQSIGLRAMRDLLGITVPAGLAWPPDGEVDQSTVETLSGLRVRGIVTSDSALPLVDDVTFTPTAPYDLPAGAGGSVTALVADDTFAALVASGPGSEGAVPAVQRVLAEAAMFTLERPNTGRDLVVTPPRIWDPGPEFANGLLHATATVPWLQPVALPSLLDHSRSTYGRALNYPQEAIDAELPPDYFEAVKSARRLQQAYVSILLENHDQLPALLDDALLRAESAQWRPDAPGGRALVAGVVTKLSDAFGKLRVASGGLVTLTSKTGKIPITIVNGLKQPVRLRLRLDPGNRLELPGGNLIELPRVDPGSVTIDVEGKALLSGGFTIDAQLETWDGTPLFGGPAKLRIRSTAFGRVALFITGGAFVVLLCASASRLVRRRRAARRVEAAPA